MSAKGAVRLYGRVATVDAKQWKEAVLKMQVFAVR